MIDLYTYIPASYQERLISKEIDMSFKADNKLLEEMLKENSINSIAKGLGITTDRLRKYISENQISYIKFARHKKRKPNTTYTKSAARFKRSEENIPIIKELRLAGNTLTVIGKELGLSRERIRQYLKEMDLVLPPSKSYVCKCGCGTRICREGYYKYHKLIPILSKEDIIKLNDEGKSGNDIAKLYNINVDYMSKYIKSLGIKLKIHNFTKYNITEEDLYELYVNRNQLATKIAKMVGCSRANIVKLITKYKLQKKTRFVVSKEELYDLYVVQRLTISEIAKKYGRCKGTIYHNLKKYNIRKENN